MRAVYRQEPSPLQQVSELGHNLSVALLLRRLQGRDGDNTAVCTVFLRALNEAGADAVSLLKFFTVVTICRWFYMVILNTSHALTLYFRMPQTLNILPLLRRLAMYSRTGAGSAISL